MKVSEGSDASKNVEVMEPFAVSEFDGVIEYSDDDDHGGNCGFCGEPLKLGSSGEMVVPGEHTEPLQRCPGAEAESFHEIEVEEHGALKSLWMEELRKVAVGEDEGMKQGRILEELETELLIRETHLEEQHLCLHQHRLASLSLPTPPTDGLPAELPQPVLQTYVLLQQVKRDLDAWVPALNAEYSSLTGTAAIRPTTDAELRKNPLYHTTELAPAMLVPTIKAPNGRKKARVVVCGNRLERVGSGGEDLTKEGAQSSTSPYSTHAGGAGGALLRCLIKKAPCENWSVASLDVATASLLAPRWESERQLLVMKPRKVLVDAGICGGYELWQIQHAMYGLTSSPSKEGCDGYAMGPLKMPHSRVTTRPDNTDDALIVIMEQ